jgi:hypothetical protein
MIVGLIWALGVTFTVLIAWWSTTRYGVVAVDRAYADPSLLLDGLIRWDAQWYLAIAADGYGFTIGRQPSEAFFPGFPSAVRAFSTLGSISIVRAGLLVSSTASLAALLVLQRWLRNRTGTANAWWGLLIFATAPAAYYLYGVPYAEGLYILAAVAAFLLVEHGHPVAAGFAGAVATASRPIGFVVVVALLIRSWETRSRLGRMEVLGASIATLGLVGFGLVLWLAVGDPLAFLSAGAEGWGHGLDWSTVLKKADFSVTGWYRLVPITQGLVVVVALLLIPSVWRRLGPAYAFYSLLVIVIPLIVRPTIVGAHRYVLAAFPLVVVVGEWCRRRPAVGFLIIGFNVVAATFFLSLFSRWFFVG